MKMRKAFLVKIFMSITLCILLCACSISFSSESEEYALQVHFLDVGQGDSIFVELPNDECMLIDAGDKNMGEELVSYINGENYTKIDYLVATHPHADHIGSMNYVVNNMDIGDIYMPKVSTNTKAYENLLTAISDKGLKIKSAKAGMTIVDNEDLTLNILAPNKLDTENLNNSSIVLKLTYKSVAFLFAGDAEKDELKEINGDLSANVLKVGHHGSRTSTTKDFLNKVSPEIAVISAGKNNQYDHPHKSTLELLEESGCKIYRTDKDRTVTVSSDGYILDTKTNGQSITGGY